MTSFSTVRPFSIAATIVVIMACITCVASQLGAPLPNCRAFQSYGARSGTAFADTLSSFQTCVLTTLATTSPSNSKPLDISSITQTYNCSATAPLIVGSQYGVTDTFPSSCTIPGAPYNQIRVGLDASNFVTSIGLFGTSSLVWCIDGFEPTPTPGVQTTLTGFYIGYAVVYISGTSTTTLTGLDVYQCPLPT